MTSQNVPVRSWYPSNSGFEGYGVARPLLFVVDAPTV